MFEIGTSLREARERRDLSYGQVTIPALAEPTPTQRHAFDLIGAPIPLTLSMT